MIAGRLRSALPLRLALVLVTALLLGAAAIAAYAHFELVDTDAFSARAASALENRDVRTVVADKVVGGLADSLTPEVLIVRPLVTSAVATLAGTPAFRRIVERAVADQHRALFGAKSSVPLNLEYASTLLVGTLRSVSPRVARAIPKDFEPALVELRTGDVRLTIARVLTDVAKLWWALLGAAVLAAAATAFAATGTRDALAWLGAAVTVAGLGVALLLAAASAFVFSKLASDQKDTIRGAVHAVWAALFSDLRSAALLAALGGAAVTAAASAGLTTGRLAAAAGRAREAAGSPRPGRRIAGGGVLVALGALLVLAPGAVARTLVVLGGIALALAGVARLSGPRRSHRRRPSPTATSPRVLAATVAALVALTAGAIALVVPAPNVPAAATARSSLACNGSVALCGRRLNEVVFPTTHNSYAASDEPGWLFANQRYGIARQLDDGIRGLTIDIHYGELDPTTRHVRTDLQAEGSSRNKVTQQIGPHAVRVADRIAGRIGLGRTTGRPSAYLCHTLCELGAEPLDTDLRDIARFLDAHRREVLVLFIEPYVPVAETERSLERTGLLSQSAQLHRDQPLPTLGELIDADTRLVVLAEVDGGSRPWYLDGFSFVQDTPFTAKRAQDLSCARERGTPDSPMLLVNHWIASFPPSPTRNERVGNDFLRRRLTTCARERGMLPNLVAVDFYERTGVVQIARQMNASP